MTLRDDDQITVHRPGKDDVQMRWGQWEGNRARYEEAGFTYTAPEPVVIDTSRPARIIKATQEACKDDDSLERWSDSQIAGELMSCYEKPEDFAEISDKGNFNYRAWAKKFVADIEDRPSLSDKQRESAIRLIRRAWK